MHRNTWKSGERRIAKVFGTYRTPLSGSSSRHTKSDSLHKTLFIEVKHRKKLVAERLWNDTCKDAKGENKIPLIVLLKKNYPDPIIICKLKDMKNISDEIKGES